MKLAVALCLTATLLVVIVSSGFVTVLAQGQVAVGVKPGDYFKYGNVVVSGPLGGADSNLDWLEYNVTMVSGTKVTIIQTGIFKNGIAVPNNGVSYTYDLEKSTLNGTHTESSPIIAANLNQGDSLPFTHYTVTKTESRTYLGVSRIVNVIEANSTTGNTTTSSTVVFDRGSGIILELQTQQTDSSGIIGGSYSVTETNIFGLSPTATPTPTLSSSSNVEPSPSIPEFSTGIIIVFVATVSATVIALKAKSAGTNAKVNH